MKRLGRLGVWYPIDRLDGAGLKGLLSKVEGLGFSAFWYPEALGYESLSIASFMLANTSRLVIGSSIANIYARDATAEVLEAYSLADATADASGARTDAVLGVA